ncbi:MAG: histidine kinase, partial [Ferruginibacter sp.]
NPLFDILTVRNMVTDNENNTWLCGHGMSRYNLQKRAIDIKMDSFPTMKIPRKEVLSLVFDANGVMYFGLAENGLIIYDPSSKKFEQLSRSNGLPDNNILALYLIQKTLWIGTASGLATYNIDTKKIVSYGNMNEDNPEEYFTGFSFYFDSTHNQLYAPFSNSVLRFDPFNFKKNNSAPSFFIENIRINEKDIIYHPSGYINLQPGENNLVVSLASINYSNAFEEQYYYRFKKNETTAWQYAGTQKNFILSNLSAGNHEIEFMVASKINSWTPQVIDLHIHIRPPFWRSAWFIIIASLLLLTTIFLLYKARVNRIKQRANIDNELAELEMKSLHAQMNPHFIFNALNSIKEMIWDDDKSNASRYLSKFAQLIRTTLEQSSQSFISVKQCVLHLEQYLEMERIRFDDFTFSIAMDENMEWDNRKMAPMLVQPLVENAIWHGLKNTTGDKVLEIKFYEEEHHVVCEISDNGPGINHVEKPGKIAATHRSIGITNIHNRLQMLNEKYHMNCSLSFIDKADKDENLHGTIAILRLSF